MKNSTMMGRFSSSGRMLVDQCRLKNNYDNFFFQYSCPLNSFVGKKLLNS